MPMPKMQVDGAQIRADRKKAGLSRQGLAQIAKMSLSTMRRIEAGQGSEANIVNLASILKTNPDKYITKEAIPNVSGRWIALYFEQEPTFPPYIVEELLELSQYSRKISGTYVTTHSDHPQGLIETRSYVIDGFVEDEFVMGKYQRKEDDPLSPRGTGYFHLAFTRNMKWCEGFCTFYTDDRLIASCLNIWIRADEESIDILREQARRVLKKSKHFYLAPMSLP